MLDLFVIAIAGFLGGMLNAVAGGGSFFTLAALVYIGVPAVSANATGTAALLPGYIASAWRFKDDIELPHKLDFKAIIIISMVGGSVGAAILLITSEQFFARLIPWLILLATLAFIAGPWLLNYKSVQDKALTSEQINNSAAKITAILALVAVCIYGGYFNGGLGIILLATLGILGQSNLHGMNGLKNVISALLTIVAVVVYALGGVIDWSNLLLLSVMAMFGGYIGAVFAYRIPQNILRGFIIFVGLTTALRFFLQG